AEQLARSVPAGSAWEEFAKRENLHACIQSRAKEAFRHGAHELGHRRTEEYLAIDPYDPKSHAELADSLARQQRYAEAADGYLRAAGPGRGGPPAGYPMPAQPFPNAGERAWAEDCCIQALGVDPYATTPPRRWPEVATNGTSALAAEYLQELEEWGA